MGGDYAPAETVRGALAAQRQAGVTPLLIGDQDALRALLAAEGVEAAPWQIVHAPEVVAMDEHAVEAVRSRRATSIRRAAEMLGADEIDAVVTMGHTGAAVAAGVLIVGRLPDVERPGLGVLLPSRGPRPLVIDVGANAEARPRHLAQFAVMGRVYQERMHSIANPRVGLLSIGEEESKGNALVHEAAALLATEAVNYAGHVDPAHIFRSAADVIVCDGFTGNVVIKSAEATAEFAFGELRFEVEQRPLAKVASAGDATGAARHAAADRLRGDRSNTAAGPQGPGADRPRPITGARSDQRLGSGRPSGPGAAGADHRIRAGSDDGLATQVDRRPGRHIGWAALMGSCSAAAFRDVSRCPRL